MYIETHFSVISPPQSRSQAVACFSTPRMYPRSGDFLYLSKFSNSFLYSGDKVRETMEVDQGNPFKSNCREFDCQESLFNGSFLRALFTFGLWNTGKYYLCKLFASFKRMIKSKGDLFGSVAQNTPQLPAFGKASFLDSRISFVRS